MEYRLGSADSNPYLALAAALGSGLYGIEHELEPYPEIRGNSYSQPHQPELALPQTLWEAAARLRKSKPAQTLFGEPLSSILQLLVNGKSGSFDAMLPIGNWIVTLKLFNLDC